MRYEELQRLMEPFFEGQQVAQGSPPTDGLFELTHDMRWALHTTHPQVLRPERCAYTVGNSTVVCTPQLMLEWIFHERCVQARVGMTLLPIHGSSEERLHFHDSYVILFAVLGNGWLCHCLDRSHTVENDPTKIAHTPVRAGDIVVIPKRVWHLSNCAEGDGMLFVALEITDEDTGYQDTKFVR